MADNKGKEDHRVLQAFLAALKLHKQAIKTLKTTAETCQSAKGKPVVDTYEACWVALSKAEKDINDSADAGKTAVNELEKARKKGSKSAAYDVADELREVMGKEYEEMTKVYKDSRDKLSKYKKMLSSVKHK